ncbi:hypothetical protein D3P08_25850 [Paenibacillus nanensis]|uniref:Uncharacterized protein n=1 Tax=Paenibacillus nanensis TaxID=393251 RepID=A0A3A1UNI8_9BACL|nr:hypothetical protein D3P08_25850 [Paenibacillus nanensis]
MHRSHWIHDVHSNGREIEWTVDNTRDGMSSEQGKRIFQCKTIRMDESDVHYVFTLGQCRNEEKEIPIFILRKDELARR